MRRFFSLLCLGHYLLFPIFGDTPTARELEARMQDYRSGHVLEPEARLRERATQFEFVFVTGFLGEESKDHFAFNRQLLERWGVPTAQLHTWNPSSAHAAMFNGTWLAQKLTALHANTRRKIIILAASKGALEVLTGAVEHAAELEPVLETVYFLQGGFGGSAVADYMMGNGRLPILWMPRPQYEMFRLLCAANLTRVTGLGFEPGMASMQTRICGAHLEALYLRTSPSFGKLQERFIFVRGKKPFAEMTGPFRLSGMFQEPFMGDNDGLIAFRDQAVHWLPGATCLDTLAQHDGFYAGENAETAALMYALVSAL